MAHTVWNVTRALKGTPPTNSPNEVMNHEGKKISAPIGKANAFVDHYANVSNLKFTRNDRTFNRLLKKRMDGQINRDEVKLFTIG